MYLIINCQSQTGDIQGPGSLAIEITPGLLPRIQRLQDMADTLHQAGEYVEGLEVRLHGVAGLNTSIELDQGWPDMGFGEPPEPRPQALTEFDEACLVDSLPDLGAMDDLGELIHSRIKLKPCGMRVDEGSVRFYAYLHECDVVFMTDAIEISTLMARLHAA